MKNITYVLLMLKLLTLSAILFARCSNTTDISQYGGTSETTSATISGRLQTDDGKQARNVTVKLTPADFNPYTSSNTRDIDSVTTDADGRYTFTITSSGIFNVSAESEEKYSFEDSVFGSLETATTVVDDTLKIPGSISGTARLKDGDDSRDIVILVLGTTVFTMPADTSGSFTIPVLAEGEYVLRVLTANNDYGYFDTVVTVRSGENTVISSPLRPPYVGIPTLESVTARIDTQTMIVTLAWQPPDTSKIAGYYIFRNTRSDTTEPLAILPNTATSFEDDVIYLNPDRRPFITSPLSGEIFLEPDYLPFGDTLRYSVAAIGKNRESGEIVRIPDFLIKGIITPDEVISLSGTTAVPDDYITGLHMDANRNFYLFGSGWIFKFDAGGQFIAEYGLDNYNNFEENRSSFVFRGFTTDKNENVYVYQAASRKLTKFSPELQPDTQITVENDYPEGSYTLFADDNDLIYQMLYVSADTVAFKTFDTELSEISSDTLPRYTFWARLYDGIVYFDNKSGMFSTEIGEYDIQSTTLTVRHIDTLINPYFPSGTDKSNYDLVDFLHTSEGGSLYIYSDNRIKILFAFDRNNNFTGRCRFPTPTTRPTFFNNDDRFYVYNKTEQQIMVYRIDL